MSAIDRRRVQTRLGVKPDGQWGVVTWTALLTFAAQGRALGTTGPQMALICATMIPKYGIDGSPACLAQFLATTAHETGNYSTFAENLDYTVQNILDTWGPGKGGRFGSAIVASPYAHNPRKLAEKVYGGRFGNRPEGSGDGWAYRGGGWIQTTFRANYQAAQDVTGLPLVAHPELLHDPLSSIEPACAYWKGSGCNGLADGDLSGRASRMRVNGGTVGLPDVLARTTRLMGLLA